MVPGRLSQLLEIITILKLINNTKKKKKMMCKNIFQNKKKTGGSKKIDYRNDDTRNCIKIIDAIV